jgi:hypothetical protein
MPPKTGDASAAPPTKAVQFFDEMEIYPGSKVAHFKQLHEKTGIAYADMVRARPVSPVPLRRSLISLFLSGDGYILYYIGGFHSSSSMTRAATARWPVSA